jgi:hypothetical protein
MRGGGGPNVFGGERTVFQDIQEEGLCLVAFPVVVRLLHRH